MTARDLYGVAVRLFGLILLFIGVGGVFGVAARMLGLSWTTGHPLMTDALASIIYLIFGAVMIFGANLIVRISYGRER
jgi:hypothetical protein